jgi:hypothetical protein
MPKTNDLPGVEGPGVAREKIQALDNRIEKWRDCIDARMKLLEKEVEARDAVIAFMKEKGLTLYRWQGDDHGEGILTLDAVEKLKLKRADEMEGE